MQGIYADCPVHGRVACSGLGGGTSDITYIGLSTHCPVPGCGRVSRLVNARYIFAGEILRYFRELSPEEIAAFAGLIQQTEDGSLTQKQARKEVRRRFPRLLSVWDWFNRNGSGVSGISGIVAVVIAAYSTFGPHQEQAPSAQDVRTQIEVQKKIFDTLERALARGKAPETQSLPGGLKPQPNPLQKPSPAGSGNRHERRKNAATNR